jgi:hemolysin III
VVVEPVAPLLRGWLHLVCFFLSLPAGAFLVATATSTRARVAVVVYSIGLSALFGVSAMYHRGGWTGAARRRMRRLDHGTIFVMIAGCYTPLCLLVLHGTLGAAVLVAVWAGAAAGLGLAITGVAERPVVGLACYVGLGWVMVVATPQLVHGMRISELALLFAGGLLYTVGGVCLGTCWPDPFPRHFGYHEVWHLMVVAAGVCHYVTIASVVGRLGA